jgi:uncharacterized protein YutE (UPF0331/DUF86 family)
MLNGIITRKLQSLDEVLAELRSLGQIEAAQLSSDWRTQRAIERDLQVLVEIVIDVCQRLISASGQVPAATGAIAIERCVQIGALSDDEAYHKMVGLRNFIVHRYEHIDITILVDMVNNHLPDFEQFRDEILAYVQKN